MWKWYDLIVLSPDCLFDFGAFPFTTTVFPIPPRPLQKKAFGSKAPFIMKCVAG